MKGVLPYAPTIRILGLIVADHHATDEGDAGESAVQYLAGEVGHKRTVIELDRIALFGGRSRRGEPAGIIVLRDFKVGELGNVDGAEHLSFLCQRRELRRLHRLGKLGHILRHLARIQSGMAGG